jgi:hypothetical protein
MNAGAASVGVERFLIEGETTKSSHWLADRL